MTLFDVVSCLKISCTMYTYIDHVGFMNTKLMTNEAYLTFLFSAQGRSQLLALSSTTHHLSTVPENHFKQLNHLKKQKL